MLIFLRGDSSYLAKAAIDQLKDRYKAKNSSSTEIVEILAEEIKPGQLVDLQAVPLFATSRLIVIRQVEDLPKQYQEQLAHFLTHLPATSVVVVWAGAELKAGNPLIEILGQAKKVIDVQSPTDGRLGGWLKIEAKNRGLELTPDQINNLIDQHGNDLWALSTELNLYQTQDSQVIVGQKKVARFNNKQFSSYFPLMKRHDWPAIRAQLLEDHQTGVPVELTIGSLAAALRYDKSGYRRDLTNLLIDLDFGLKTGLIDEGSVIALLVSHLPKPKLTRVQWETVWGEIAS